MILALSSKCIWKHVSITIFTLVSSSFFVVYNLLITCALHFYTSFSLSIWILILLVWFCHRTIYTFSWNIQDFKWIALFSYACLACNICYMKIITWLATSIRLKCFKSWACLTYAGPAIGWVWIFIISTWFTSSIGVQELVFSQDTLLIFTTSQSLIWIMEFVFTLLTFKYFCPWIIWQILIIFHITFFCNTSTPICGWIVISFTRNALTVFIHSIVRAADYSRAILYQAIQSYLDLFTYPLRLLVREGVVNRAQFTCIWAIDLFDKDFIVCRECALLQKTVLCCLIWITVRSTNLGFSLAIDNVKVLIFRSWRFDLLALSSLLVWVRIIELWTHFTTVFESIFWWYWILTVFKLIFSGLISCHCHFHILAGADNLFAGLRIFVR